MNEEIKCKYCGKNSLEYLTVHKSSSVVASKVKTITDLPPSWIIYFCNSCGKVSRNEK